LTRRPTAEKTRSRRRLGFPAAVRSVQRQQSGPGDQLAGEGDQFQPDLVLCGAVQGQVPQSGVFGDDYNNPTTRRPNKALLGPVSEVDHLRGLVLR
jgi:hypothetical protein